ncbi:phage-shock protein [Lentilactobacillus parafarraginis]|uniref:Phage shock protein G domain protein n=2 Tax=Lentilactobacillus parafarraginis TaxID=390842 RepID=A0A0R1YYP8_9LACO|nr:hypothetical protein [Lentilactobacillus parafarraginis]KRM45732.1 phage shock protein G domain protein [Lentilactobacillus parafarraginis DSM 18390 = JCM 14109]TLQ20757.1 phage-shock protein [Lentilactobacillus parafarraginis]
MTFNWKYALFNNVPLIITLIIDIFMVALKVDPIWLMLAFILTWIAWYAYAGRKVYLYHPELNYHHYRRGFTSILIATVATIGLFFLLVELQLIGNIPIFITWLTISNFLVDGFSKFKGVQ